MERIFGEALDFDIERQIIRGTGTVEFLGILNADARIAESRGTANQIARADLDNMLSRLLPGCFSSGRLDRPPAHPAAARRVLRVGSCRDRTATATRSTAAG